MQKIIYAIVHHTAVSRTKNPDQWNATNEYHREKWDMRSQLGYYVGYNYEISASGTVRQARLIGEETVACTGHNFDSIHICLDGNFDIELPTKEQEKTLQDLLLRLVDEYKINWKDIVPHRMFANKSCYGNLLPDDWAQKIYLQGKISWLRRLIARLTGRAVI